MQRQCKGLAAGCFATLCPLRKQPCPFLPQIFNQMIVLCSFFGNWQHTYEGRKNLYKQKKSALDRLCKKSLKQAVEERGGCLQW